MSSISVARPLAAVKTNIEMISKKNKYVLGDTGRPARQGAVNYEWWSTGEGAERENVGDTLGPLICDWLISQKGVVDDGDSTRFLLSVGSVLGKSLNDSVVWGSGLLKPRTPRAFVPGLCRLDIRAVRGPQTRRVLMEKGFAVPEVYGDPGILMPLIYTPKVNHPKDVLFVPHHKSHYDVSDCEGLRTISPIGTSYSEFIDALANSSLVVTGSLHAVILAEAYGCPAVLVADRDNFSDFKYRDWYESTGRSAFPVVGNIRTALETEPCAVPDLSSLQAGLLGSFPYDLWEE